MQQRQTPARTGFRALVKRHAVALSLDAELFAKVNHASAAAGLSKSGWIARQLANILGAKPTRVHQPPAKSPPGKVPYNVGPRRVVVRTGLRQEQVEKVERLAQSRGVSMSKVLSDLVDAVKEL